MSSYIEYMREEATRAFGALFTDVEEVRFVDFPDHPNVGDSAIALGQMDFFARAGIVVKSVNCIGTYHRGLLKTGAPVFVHGGGNIAGFFDGIDQHRNRFGRELASDTLLIQGPQSIHFNSDYAKNEFAKDFLSRSRIKVAVRDEAARRALAELNSQADLAPDAVHHLGSLAAPDPTRRQVVLKRRDQEATTREVSGVDWLKDTRLSRAETWLRWKIRYLGPAGRFLNPSPAAWQNIAQARFERGVNMLSAGETVVTDRLHGMLIGLQMGRSVVAVDNNNQKLSKYAETWFGASQPSLSFARNFDEALKLV